MRLRLPIGRLVVAATAAVGTLAVSAGAAAWATGPSLAGPPRAGAALPAARQQSTAAELNRDGLRLAEALSATFPTTFGGLTVGAQGLTIYTTRPHTGMAAVVDQYIPKGWVAYALSNHTLGALNAIQRSLVNNWLAYQDRGIDIVGWQPDVAGSTEVLQVVGPTPDQIAWLQSLYPRGMLTVRAVGLAPLPTGFVARVAAEPHAQVPRGLGPLLGAIGMLVVASIGLVVVVRRRRQARAARLGAVIPLELAPAAASSSVEDEPELAAASA